MNHAASADNAQAPVLLEQRGAVAIVTLNRADNRNSMTPELLDGFAATIQQVRQLEGIRCAVITGKGNCFSAGADFRSVLQRDRDGRVSGEKSFAMYGPFLSVLELEVPVIGALQGHAVGGGFGLALTCDLRVAHKGSRYGANFARIGLHSGMGISDVLPRLIGVPRALEMLLSGKLVSGATGADWGLFNYATEADDVLPKALALAEEIAQAAPIAVRLIKQAVYANLGWNPRQAARREAFEQAATLATEDCREGVAALLEKRPPQFQGR